MELDATFRPAIDPVDGISDTTDSDDAGNHYSRLRQFRRPHGPASPDRAAQRAYHADMQETRRLEEVYENGLIDEVLRVSRLPPLKQLRLAKKDGLDKKAYDSLVPLSRDVERSQERSVVCFARVSWQWN